MFDLVVIGGGGAGIISAITSARDGKKVLLLEQLPTIASKLKATGGGRCNLTNTLDDEEFMSHFGSNGLFMRDALKSFNHKDLIAFFDEIGVKTHAPDGFRVFPTTHNSTTIIQALSDELQRCGVKVICSQKATNIISEDAKVKAVQTQDNLYKSSNVIIATGGLGYPTLGATGDGYALSSKLGHKVTQLFPAMMPLKTKESWVSSCRADTIADVEIRVALKKYKKLHAKGDLIFTKDGIRGPVVLDFAREITPLLSKLGEVPILLNLTKKQNEEQIALHIKEQLQKDSQISMHNLVSTLLPKPLALELCKLCDIDADTTMKKIAGASKAKLLNYLAYTPLTVVKTKDDFKKAMITRGGISLKEIDPKTMKSKIIDGLYFCGEVVDIDGPCGGYNLQWSFASGYLAGKSI